MNRRLEHRAALCIAAAAWPGEDPAILAEWSPRLLKEPEMLTRELQRARSNFGEVDQLATRAGNITRSQLTEAAATLGRTVAPPPAAAHEPTPLRCPLCGGELTMCTGKHTDGPGPRLHCRNQSVHNFVLGVPRRHIDPAMLDDELIDFALNIGTYMVGAQAETVVEVREALEDWERDAAAEAVALFRPQADEILNTARAGGRVAGWNAAMKHIRTNVCTCHGVDDNHEDWCVAAAADFHNPETGLE